MISNISRKQHEMKLIFKLGTLRPNGLNINFNFLWLWVNRALHLRELKQQWFSVLLTVYFMRALSVRAYAYNFLYRVVKSIYWRRAKPETSSLQEQFWHFSEHFCLTYHFSPVSRVPCPVSSVTHHMSFLLIPTVDFSLYRLRMLGHVVDRLNKSYLYRKCSADTQEEETR